MHRALVLTLIVVGLLAAAPLPADRDSPFGSHLPCDDTLLQLGREAGVTWTRAHDYWIPFYWAPTEPEPGKWVWADEQVAKVRGYGYEILGMLGMPPEWAAVKVPPEQRPGGYIAQWQTRDLQAWEDYVYQTVSHYRGSVRCWEVWNEPNCDGFFAPRDDPALYIVLLEHAYAAAKRADPDCLILAPSIASLDLEWMQTVLRLGLLRHCDVVSLHAYLLPPGRDLVARFEELRELLRFYRSDKPIWITEVGWDVGADKIGDPAAENWKANNHVRLNLIALAHGVSRIFSYPFAGGGWGFVRGEPPTPLPVFHAYRTLTHVLDGAHPTAILSETPGLWAYLYSRGDTAIAALWAEDPTQVEIPVGVGQVEMVSRDGESRTVSARDGWLTLDLGPGAVYLVGVNEQRMRALAMCRVSPSYQRVVAGARMEVKVEVANPSAEPLPVTVRPVGLAAWPASPAVLRGRLGPQERRTFSFRLRAPASAALPAAVETILYADDRPTALTARRVALDFEVAANGARLARVRATVDVAPEYGFLRDWLIAGPFDNTDRRGLDRMLGPEQTTDRKASFATWDGPQPWRRFHTADVIGIADLGQFLNRRDAVSACALCFLHSPREQRAQLRVGRNDEMAVFLGGKEIWRQTGGRRLIPDDGIVPITLPAGTTPLLLKVCNLGGEWGFAARLTDEKGQPLQGVEITLSP